MLSKLFAISAFVCALITVLVYEFAGAFLSEGAHFYAIGMAFGLTLGYTSASFIMKGLET